MHGLGTNLFFFPLINFRRGFASITRIYLDLELVGAQSEGEKNREVMVFNRKSIHVGGRLGFQACGIDEEKDISYYIIKSDGDSFPS